MNKIKRIILKNRFLSKVVKKIVGYKRQKHLYKSTSKLLQESQNIEGKIFYLGIPAHTNLGDLAQGMCIRSWLCKNYPTKKIVEIETNALVNTRRSVLNELKKAYKPTDFIVFQSGYTTTDLGGYADEMHRAVMEILPNAKMLMLPQTIFFKSEQNRQRTSNVYNSMGNNMLFLARDRVSMDMANEMFPNVPKAQYPDIVTTLIGKYKFENDRKGILCCCRNDSEKYYSNEEIDNLISKCSSFCSVDKIDTTKIEKASTVVKNAEKYIMQEIKNYSMYKVIITDRYHGTIFSLVAGTPVVIIKTNDHKVVTGAEWFKGIYDDYVYLAESLDEAYEIAKKLYEKDMEHKLNSYFEEKYYDVLPRLFAKSVEIE